MGYVDREAQRAYQNDWLKRRRQAWIEKHGPCAECGSSKNLEVDHKEPDEKWTNHVWSYSKERREKELAKCQVLCHTCHKAKSVRETRLRAASNVRGHGTPERYKHDKCRCVACVAVHNYVRRMKRNTVKVPVRIVGWKVPLSKKAGLFTVALPQAMV